MRLIIFSLLLFSSSFAGFGILLQQEFNRSAYYKAISSENVNEINDQLSLLKESAIAEKEAYEGALLMKKAGQERKPKDKLNLFRSGERKLEACIKKESLNAELRLHRLLINEKSHKIINYKS